MKKNLIITGGIFHPFSETSDTLSKILNSLGYDSEITLDVEEGIKNINDFDLVTFNALRWRMLNHEKYIPFLDEWQFNISEKSKNTLDSYIRSGGSMIAFHTSSICFDNWDGWSKILGGKWIWDESFHPPQGKVEVNPIKNHFLNNNFNTFEIEDEVYHNLYLEPDSKPFLKAKTHETNEEHIVGWTYNYENGKVVYNALGHDSNSLLKPEMVNIIKKSVKWVSGDKNA